MSLLKKCFGAFIGAGLAGFGFWMAMKPEVKPIDTNHVKEVRLFDPWTGERLDLEQLTRWPMPSKAKDRLSDKERLAKYAEFIAPFEIGGNEHKIHKVYDGNASPNVYEPNVGVGHNLSKPSSGQAFRIALPGVDRQRVLDGELALSRDQIDALFSYDLMNSYRKARAQFANFDEVSIEVQGVYVSMVYRGEKNPKTNALLNRGMFVEAAAEYLDNNEYRNCKNNKMSGIKARMEANAQILLDFAKKRNVKN